MLQWSIFILVTIGSSALSIYSEANDYCASGREIGVYYPQCFDRENPNPLEKACRHPSHGLANEPLSEADIAVKSPWVDGGTGLSYEDHCSKSLSLEDNQKARFKGLLSESSRVNEYGKQQYLYKCGFQITTYPYKERVSKYCVPEDERFPKIRGEKCLSDEQKHNLAIIEENIYASSAISSYINSLNEDEKFAIDKYLNQDEMAIMLCSDCSNINPDLPKPELYYQQIECLVSLMSYDPFLGFTNDDEKRTLKALAESLERILDIGQLQLEDNKQRFLEAYLEYIQEDL